MDQSSNRRIDFRIMSQTKNVRLVTGADVPNLKRIFRVDIRGELGWVVIDQFEGINHFGNMVNKAHTSANNLYKKLCRKYG